MSENAAFLINEAAPALAPSNEFQVRTNAVRLFGANLGATYTVQVFVGNEESGAWVPLYINGVPITLSDTNNVAVLIVSGQYQVVPNGETSGNGIVYYQESIETDHDARVLYVLQTPAPAGGGGGGGPSPGDTVQEVGVAFGRNGTGGALSTYSREDHVHSFDVLPNSVGISGSDELEAITPIGPYTVSALGTTYACLTREHAYIMGACTVSPTAGGQFPQIILPGLGYTDSSTGLQMSLVTMTLAVVNQDNQVVPSGVNPMTGGYQASGTGSDTQWNFQFTAMYALQSVCPISPG